MNHPIFKASSENDTHQLQALLQQEPQAVHLRDYRGQTPLHGAVKAGNLEATELLLQHGADPNAQGQLGEAPLHLADSTDLTRLLLRHGANPTLEDHDHITPLDWALIDNNTELFLVLAEAAPQLGTPNYQLLRRAYQEKLLVEADYHQQFRIFRVVKLGWTERSERCLAWQLTPTTAPHQPEWRCYKVAELSSLFFGDPWSQASQPDARAKPPECVVVVDEIKTLTPQSSRDGVRHPAAERYSVGH